MTQSIKKSPGKQSTMTNQSGLLPRCIIKATPQLVKIKGLVSEGGQEGTVPVVTATKTHNVEGLTGGEKARVLATRCAHGKVNYWCGQCVGWVV